MKFGYVAIIGRPNVGKSTLLNHLIGEKLAGVSDKPQTTRHCIRGILTLPELKKGKQNKSGGQIVFLDTPGFHKPHDLLGNWMIQEAQKFVEEADLVVWMVLPGNILPEDQKILELIKTVKVPVLLAINQIDRFPKPHILPVIEHYHKLFAFREVIPISARQGENIELLVEKILENLPEGEPLFPEDQISDQNERFVVREIIAEKLYHYTGEEIPYSTSVVVEEFKDRNEQLTDIEATIFVERDSQKKIVIGQQGQKIKQIGQAARIDIERFIGKKVFLQLWVKTLDSWKKNENSLRRLGYE